MSWNCLSCTFENNKAMPHCETCNTPKGEECKTGSNFGFAPPPPPQYLRPPVQAPEKLELKWPCRTCTYENIGSASTCEVCDTPRSVAISQERPESEEEPESEAEAASANIRSYRLLLTLGFIQ